MINYKGIQLNDEIWSLIENDKDIFKIELTKEINKGHILYGINVKEIAFRIDKDDVLFELLDGSGKYAIVHLTWSHKREKQLTWPTTRIYKNIEDIEIFENDY